MNIAILSRGELLYSTQSLLKAGLKRNHNIEVIDLIECQMIIENGLPLVKYRGELLDDLDAIIPRIGASNTYLGASLVRHFEAMEVFSTVASESIVLSRDKWACFQALSKSNIAMPNTVLGNGLEAESLIEELGRLPIIIKFLKGTHGNGVLILDTKRSLMSTIEGLNAIGKGFLLQEYIEESEGSDIRAIIVDGVVIAAMKRQSKDGDFRSNLHRGGSSSTVKLTYQEEALAIKAAKALGLGVCGVDILRSKRGPLVLEVNSTPGLEGIETTTGENVSRSVIGYVERNK